MTAKTNIKKLFIFLATMIAMATVASGCSTETEETPDNNTTISPFSITARVDGATVDEVAGALATYIHTVDDTTNGYPSDWTVVGGNELEEGESPLVAAVGLPNGCKVVEVCNHEYAGMAMSFGAHHGVALPCEISIAQVEDHVEVVLLNPEAIFGVFFGDVPPEAMSQMGGLAATVRAELEDLVEDSLAEFDAEFPGTDVGPSWTQEELMATAISTYSIPMDIEIPDEYLASDEDRQAFHQLFVAQLLQTLTHTDMESYGSEVAGLSVEDWRSARTHAINLPGQVSVVEVCSPTYAAAAMSTGSHHGPALPCEIAIWVEDDTLRVHVLDPMFIFPTFFSDAPEEMMSEMGGLATAVQNDLQLIVSAAQDALLTQDI